MKKKVPQRVGAAGPTIHGPRATASTLRRPIDDTGPGVTDTEAVTPSSPLARLVAIVRAATTEQTATIVAALLAVRDEGARAVDLCAVARAAGLGDRLAATLDALVRADRAVVGAFDLPLLGTRYRSALVLDGGWEDARHPGRREGDEPAVPADDERRRVRLSASLVRLLDEPLPLTASAGTTPADAPVLDGDTRAWMAALRVAAGSAGSSGGPGGHLLLRCVRPDAREVDDLADALARAGVAVHRVDDARELALSLLRAELHAGVDGAVVLVAADHVAEAAGEGADEHDVSTASGELTLTTFARRATPWLRLLRCPHVWRVPEGRLSPVFNALVGGCVGPIRTDTAWSAGVLAATAPGLGDDGARALARRASDPRDAAAMVAAARRVAAAGVMSLDEACAFVARSFAGERAPGPDAPADFDPRLLVCDPEALLLLDRAGPLAANGGRVLAWGPPGGGKSSWARVLGARAAAGRPVIAVTPATVLARSWGATERLLRNLWARAADEGAVLLVDELDALCAAREPGSSSGNAYIIRCLTDEWLRNLDDHPAVPVIATVNDPLAIDDAVRRRFVFVIQFGDALSPDRERLAWRLILRAEPPPGWAPVGASVADVALARARCRMLGLTDPDALASAVARAREARLGPGRAGAARRGGSVH